jgi:hypothetical protein
MNDDFHDYPAIRQAVQQYIDGGRGGSSETMKLGFHENAAIHGYLGTDLISAPIQGLYDWVDGNPPVSNVADCIASIDVYGSIAMVRVELDDWGGHRFTDLLSLLKVDGEWKIVCKVFHLHA